MLQGIADMSSNLPIVRDTRVRDRLATAGQTVFTFDAPLFDAADLKVFVQAAPGAPFIERVTGFAVALLEDNAGGEVMFAAPPLAIGSTTPTVVRLKGQRTHERLTDVTRGGVVRSVSLEAEFDRATVVLQELRRDVDGVVGAVDQVVETVADAVETVTSTAAAIIETAAEVNTAAGDAADAAALADRLANETPGTPVGAGYSARHWAHEAATLAATLDLANYSTTAQIDTMLASYVLKTLTIASGTAILINGGASAQLTGTITISLDLSAKALTQATWTAGVSTTEAPISPEKLQATIAALATPSEYVSSEIAYTVSSTVTLTHGLGAAPAIVDLWMVCKVADRGYSVGDIVKAQPAIYSASASSIMGVQVATNSTQIIVSFGDVLSFIPQKTGGSGGYITASSWRIVVRARK